MSDVALPDDHKQLLLNTFQSFDQFQKVSCLVLIIITSVMHNIE